MEDNNENSPLIKDEEEKENKGIKGLYSKMGKGSASIISFLIGVLLVSAITIPIIFVNKTKFREFTVKFLNYDGTILQEEKCKENTYAKYNKENPKKDNTVQYTYTFKGWDKDIDKTLIVSDTTFNAVFDESINKYLITFLNDDETILQSSEFSYGSMPEFKGIPSKPDDEKYTYTFEGWEPQLVSVTQNATYKAKYSFAVKGGCVYELNEDKKSYSVSGLQNKTLASCTILSKYDGLPVTSIKPYAFKDCKSLSSVSISESVTSIKEGAFYGCSALSNISIPESVTSIGNYAFALCSTLNSIVIPKNVTFVSSTAFYNCEALDKIIVDENNTIYDSRDNSNSIIKSDINELVIGCKGSVIPSSVTSIGERAFEKCLPLTSIKIPNGVISIKNDAFNSCESLNSISIPNSVTTIGIGAFFECSSLEKVDINVESNLNTIKESAFYKTPISSIYIPSKVSIIEDSAFSQCYNLKSVEFSKDINLDSLNTGVFYSCASLSSINIPTSVTKIMTDAFYCCSSLSSLSIPKNVISIGTNAFSMCKNLNIVTIEDNSNLTYIDDKAFFNTSVSSFDIPSLVTHIGYNALLTSFLSTINFLDSNKTVWTILNKDGTSVDYDISDKSSDEIVSKYKDTTTNSHWNKKII